MSSFFETLFTLRLRFLDIVVVSLAVAVTVFCTVQIYGKKESTMRLVIQGKKGNWVYPLNQSIEIDIPGPLGHTTVKLEDGKAQVIASPCINQTCVTSGTVQRRGQWIACLPNAVFVRVEVNDVKQAARAELDAVVW